MTGMPSTACKSFSSSARLVLTDSRCAAVDGLIYTQLLYSQPKACS